MERVSLGKLLLVFLRLGATAFGGPAAHVAMMEAELVRKRRWLTHEQFLDLFGTANLLPGPSSTETAILIGHHLRGRAGLVTAGLAFILPAAIMVAAIAWAYVRYGSLPQVSGILYGVKPVIIAIILQALWRLGRTAIKTRILAIVAAASLAAGLANVSPLPILFVGGAVLAAARWTREDRRSGAVSLLILLALGTLLLFGPALVARLAPGGGSASAVPFRPGITPLFLYFLKVGSVLYGSGYVLLAFLRTDLVSRWHWLTASQLLDATAVGQVTPGPVFTTATFIGYVLAGPWGAATATVGIFLPAFVYTYISGPVVARLRRPPWHRRF